MTGDILECRCGSVVIIGADGVRWLLTNAPIWRFMETVHLCPVVCRGGG